MTTQKLADRVCEIMSEVHEQAQAEFPGDLPLQTATAIGIYAARLAVAEQRIAELERALKLAAIAELDELKGQVRALA